MVNDENLTKSTENLLSLPTFKIRRSSSSYLTKSTLEDDDELPRSRNVTGLNLEKTEKENENEKEDETKLEIPFAGMGLDNSNEVLVERPIKEKKPVKGPSLSNPIGKFFAKTKKSSNLTGLGNTLLLPGLAMAGARVRSNSTCHNMQKMMASSSSNISNLEQRIRHHSAISARSSHNLQLNDLTDLRKSASRLASNSRLNEDQKKILLEMDFWISFWSM